MSLAERVAILSGVGPGLGRDTAAVFVREGAYVVLVARNETRIASIADELRAVGSQVIHVRGDLLDESACREVVRRTIEAFGRLDVLVNLAFAESSWKTILDVDADLSEWRNAFDVNLFGTLRMTRAAIGPMIAQGAGSIIMVNSIASAGLMPQIADYSGSKAALSAMTRTLALELGPHGIRVNGVHPGTMWGPYNEGRFSRNAERSGTTLEVEKARAAAAAPLRYIPDSIEVAEVLAFFASERARAITGQELHVNAGQHLH